MGAFKCSRIGFIGPQLIFAHHQALVTVAVKTNLLQYQYASIWILATSLTQRPPMKSIAVGIG